jgi:ribulose-5-phosphate 4-epimerase/fuculose-1-phosphate aldolase
VKNPGGKGSGGVGGVLSGGMWPHLRSDEPEPVESDPVRERARRKRDLALAYRIFGAKHWGELGDGHISARDPERADCFWLLAYGVAFNAATVSKLVLVGPDGEVLEGDGTINPSAHHIHWPIHAARPDIVSAAHTHTPYGTPFSAEARPFEIITQEATLFVDDHVVFDDEEVQVLGLDGGKRIAAALGDAGTAILRNHGLLTVGSTVAEAIGLFVTAERAAEAQLKATRAKPISLESARAAKADLTATGSGDLWQRFAWLCRTHVPDPSVVEETVVN